MHCFRPTGPMQQLNKTDPRRLPCSTELFVLDSHSDQVFPIFLCLKNLYSGFQLLFSRFEYPGPSFLGLQFNLYTMPAMVSVLLISSTLFLMIFKFNEVPMPKKEKRSSIDSAGFSFPVYRIKAVLQPLQTLLLRFCLLLIN